MRYEVADKPDTAGTIKHAGFEIEGQSFAVMDSARAHNFTFNEATSFIVPCNTQEEIDYFWTKLSADPKSEQCGWLKDKFGLSWQIVPTVLDEMLQDKAALPRVTEAFLEMKKFDIAKLKEAYNQGRAA
jgi:predicted 3-demethylubiquinone-9 3-methyltransferase (glyoxalase superfamily)